MNQPSDANASNAIPEVVKTLSMSVPPIQSMGTLPPARPRAARHRPLAVAI
jgi:hypothetical protein